MSRLSFYLLCRNSPVVTGLLSGLLLLVACEKEPVPLTANSVIKGVAYIGTTDTEEGIAVVANGPYGKSSALTDKNGQYTISGLGNGTYFLDYSKEGYGTIRQYNIQLFGSDTVRAVNTKLFKKPDILKLPTLKVPYIGVRPRAYPERPWICIETDITKQNAATYGFELMICLNTEENVSWDNYKICDFSWDSQFNDNACTFYIDPKSLQSTYKEGFPFKSGDKVFVRGYPCNEDESNGYLDTYLGVRQYSTLDKTRSTNVVSFIMP